MTSNLAFSSIIIQDNWTIPQVAEYLKQVSALLVSDLAQVTELWNPANKDSNYAGTFTKAAADSFTKALTAAQFLASDELSTERMFVAYDLQDQENEHSCIFRSR